MNIEIIFLAAFVNVFTTAVIYFMFALYESDRKLKYGLFICWMLFSLAVEHQTAKSFPLMSILFGFGYFLAYYAIRSEYFFEKIKIRDHGIVNARVAKKPSSPSTRFAFRSP